MADWTDADGFQDNCCRLNKNLSLKRAREASLEREIDVLAERLIKRLRLVCGGLAYRITGHFFRWMPQFCRVRFIDLEPEEWRRTNAKELPATRHPWWSTAYLYCYLICLCHLMLNSYNQYVLDFTKRRLDMRPAKSEIAKLNATIQEKTRLLKLIGAPHMQLSFVIECVTVLAVICTLLAYLAPQVYIKRRLCYNLYFVRLFLDYPRELTLMHGRIRGLVSEYIESSRSYSRFLMLGSSGGGGAGGGAGGAGGGNICPSCETRQLQMLFKRQRLPRTLAEAKAVSARAQLIERRLVRMFVTGKLMPVNRQAKWVAGWARILPVALTLSFSYSIVNDATAIYALFFSPQLSSQHVHYSPADWLFTLSIVLILPAINVTCIFYGATLVVIVDLILVGRKLRQMADKCMARHQINLVKLSRLSSGNSDNSLLLGDTSNQMNCDIVLLLMHYKLFIRDIRVFRDIFEVTYTAFVILIFLMPIIGIVHVPYFESTLGIKFKGYFKWAFASLLLPIALSQYPSCHLYARCLHLFKSLTGFLNLAVYVQTRQNFGQFYDEHLMSTLRRETSDSVRFKEENVMRVARIPSSYSTVMKVHFYLILFITVLMTRKFQSETGGIQQISTGKFLTSLF